MTRSFSITNCVSLGLLGLHTLVLLAPAAAGLLRHLENPIDGDSHAPGGAYQERSPLGALLSAPLQAYTVKAITGLELRT